MSTGGRLANTTALILVGLLQAAGGMVVVVLFYLVFRTLDMSTTGGWLLSLLGIWLGFSLGIHWVGEIACLLRKRIDVQRCGWRLAVTALAVLIPLVCLLVPGLRIGPANRELFDELITRRWQPILGAVALVSGAAGYQAGAWWCRNKG